MIAGRPRLPRHSHLRHGVPEGLLNSLAAEVAVPQPLPPSGVAVAHKLLPPSEVVASPGQLPPSEVVAAPGQLPPSEVAAAPEQLPPSKVVPAHHRWRAPRPRGQGCLYHAEKEV